MHLSLPRATPGRTTAHAQETVHDEVDLPLSSLAKYNNTQALYASQHPHPSRIS
jgi:hypothetical protein